MCGIAGSYRARSPEAVRKMIDRLRHRGPDGTGQAETPAGALGHTRLAILDVASGQQPIRFHRHWISYNGEVYNHQELRRRYLADQPMRTGTDTEVVLRLYALMGPRCVEWLDGMFAFAIQGDDGLFLARDPLGIKPLYIGVRGATLFFASEIKALSQVTDDIHEFPAGCWYHTRSGMVRYYTVGKEGAPPDTTGSLEEAPPAIRNAMQDAVHKQLMSDVPLGVSLSGGLDSSIIALLAREALDRLDTFAVGMEGSSDLAAAREVAAFLGTQHHEYQYTQKDIEAALPDVLYYLESFDPALVRSAIPNYFLSRLASEHVKVILTGEGADELYAGYAYMRSFTDPDALQTELLDVTAALHNTNLQRGDRMSMAHGLEARPPFLDVSAVALAFRLPAAWKVQTDDRPEKALLRHAFADSLPPNIVNRRKQKFSKGAGSSETIAHLADDTIDDAELDVERERLKRRWNYHLPNKEALYYYRILQRFYRDEWILPNMGQSRSL